MIVSMCVCMYEQNLEQTSAKLASICDESLNTCFILLCGCPLLQLFSFIVIHTGI
jgi:hypothetical protein